MAAGMELGHHKVEQFFAYALILIIGQQGQHHYFSGGGFTEAVACHCAVEFADVAGKKLRFDLCRPRCFGDTKLGQASRRNCVFTGFASDGDALGDVVWGCGAEGEGHGRRWGLCVGGVSSNILTLSSLIFQCPNCTAHGYVM